MKREGITAIICDDHPAFAKGLAKLLEAEGFNVFGVAGSADEAERMVREMLPDLVFMDVGLPKTDGIEGTRRIRGASPTTKVMILTVSDEENDLYWALRAGASGYITKDREVSEISDSARAILRGQLVIPADMAHRFLKDLEGADPNALSACWFRATKGELPARKTAAKPGPTAAPQSPERGRSSSQI